MAYKPPNILLKMSNFQSPIIVRHRVMATPVRPQRIRRRTVVTAAELSWLVGLITSINRQRPLAPAPRPELVPGLCAKIEGGDCCVCMEEVERNCVRRFGCGHETCITCYTHIYGTTAKCPLCRAEIKHVLRAPEKKIISVNKKKWCVCACVFRKRRCLFHPQK